LSDQFYDVIVVGAGPAGSYVAYELASLGHDVAVFEEKSASGLNACCTGIISTECFRSLGLGADVILTELNSAKFFSPSGRYLKVQTEKIQAYVVDRPLLDETLVCRAQSKGAQYFFSCPVTDVIQAKDSMQVETLCSGAREIFSARVVVLASGFRARLAQKLGMGRIRSFLVGAQAEVETGDVDEFEVHFGQKIAPGAFAWVVPASTNKVYVGLLATSQARLYLQEFLNNLFGQGRITSRELEIGQKGVPVGTLARSYGDRVVVVGDAAGQVKPTTGGGIYFGHLAAKIAAQVLDEALTRDNLAAGQLSQYQRAWKKKMGKELSRGYWARWAYAKLSDQQIDGIFNMFDSDGVAEALLNSDGFSFDWHSRLILTVLRRSSAYPLLKIKRLLSREASL
jgi:digeranylgeranylglycerophospholipid reductase